MMKSISLKRYYHQNPWFGFTIFALFSILFMVLEIINNRFWLADFEVYYKSAQRLLAGENLFRIPEDDFYVFKYSPTSALYFIPFTIFSFATAKIIYWFTLSGIMIYGFYLSAKLTASQYWIKNFAKINTLVLLAILILIVHIQRELHLGQVNHILLVLYILAAYFYQNKRPKHSALFLAISLFIKPFALIFIPYFIVKKNYQAIVVFIISVIVLFFLPLLFYSFPEFLQQSTLWFDELMIELNNKQDLLQEANHTIFSILARYTPVRLITFTPVLIKTYQIALLSLIAVSIWWFINKGKNIQNSGVAEFALLISMIPLLSFTSHNAFGFNELSIFLLLAFFSKFDGVGKTIIIMGFIFTGCNIHDLWGHDLSNFINNISLVSWGTLLIIIALFRGRQKGIF
ncbi:MAG: glycosyltransferase family 87 protein [Bacteroidales bacterium]